MSEENTPVLIGAAQWRGQDSDPGQAPSPGKTAVATARAAADDARVSQEQFSSLDLVGLTAPMGWRAHNATGYVADSLGATAAKTVMVAVGGEGPLRLLDRFAGEIAKGKARSALLAGTHNLRTVRLARKTGTKLQWTEDASGVSEVMGDSRPGSSEAEAAVGMDLPPSIYPIFENALRAKRGLSLEAHSENVGRLMSAFTRVASRNPYAWFPVERSADELTRASSSNRMISFPYTKYLNSIMETDQAAAVWLVSVAEARRLGVPESRWIYYGGGGGAIERAWFPSERPDFGSCPALAIAAHQALAQAGVGLDDVNAFDFYSCFPVAVEMACEMLGLAEDDPRGLTRTGGLPYAGGPGNNYTLHSLATMIQDLRADPGVGLVTGNGWYLTKHSACVLGASPFGASRTLPTIDPGPEGRAVQSDVTGGAEIRAYTVLYDRDGAPARGIVVGDTDAGERFLANTPSDRQVLEGFVAEEQIGGRGRVTSDADGLRFDPSGS